MKDALKIFASATSPLDNIPEGGLSIPSLTGASDAFLALCLAEKRAPSILLAITGGLPEADRLAEDLRTVSAYSKVRILEFPPLLNDDKISLGTRIKTIAALRSYEINPYPAILVASYPALASKIKICAKTPSHPISLKMSANGEKPAVFNLTLLAAKVTELGYERMGTVDAPGRFSIRGGIFDIWPIGEEFPVRAEFFGDDLESLRTFSNATQLSIKPINEIEILPVREEESALDEENSHVLLSELLPKSTSILALEHNAYRIDSLFAESIEKKAVIYTGDPPAPKSATTNFITSPLPGFSELNTAESRRGELFESARKRLDMHLERAAAKRIHILKSDNLSRGFEIDGLIVVAKSDRTFTKNQSRYHPHRTITGGARINDFDDLEMGEYVVHADYGVGRFIGSSEILVGDSRREVFTVEYADGGKLHVPSAHAHLLTRYVGVKGMEPKLHRLDGKRWAKDRKDAQNAVMSLAAALLETQASRETVPGFSYDVNCSGIREFEEEFPYEETPDQKSAIIAIKNDLASPKPMDRLICGDAGYGKTEVAMRAAFITAMNSKQVAVLAPTTVLAEQHFETFTSRFDNTPIRIESVSRFQSASSHEGTYKRLESGACDIVIGTHALLTGKIRFRDLGLIIIDEEQRFGVRHKEFLKNLRATADVLTISATPIPRTLYLSLTGARDLSLLRSPPQERVAVDTRIVRDSDEIIRTAIEHEIERAGQVYFLHNRVSSIHLVEKRLKRLCPNARIIVAHGQMDSQSLARKMRDFERGKYDILLSTTIISSGIDIPRANTILVDKAETFGMADLYQLRGRVGRSSTQGYAYFLTPPSGIIEFDARERLTALKRHGGLGGGYNLAMRDLELRGAGNLLGSQQSGHIASVGFTLYCQLLQRTIAMMKGEKIREIVDVKLNLDFIDLSPASTSHESAASLPYEYVEEDSERMRFMKRLAEAVEISDVRKISGELKDRFGKLPVAAKRLIKMSSLRVHASKARISHIDVKGHRAHFYRLGSKDIAFIKTLKGKGADQKLSELISICNES
jgi:transcription-repair coupling factor (superfamily II helicase)